MFIVLCAAPNDAASKFFESAPRRVSCKLFNPWRLAEIIGGTPAFCVERKMMASPGLIKSTIEALYKPIESIVATIAGPAARELALVLQDAVKEYRLKRWVRCFKRTQKLLADAGIKPKAVKPMLLFEILDGASLEDDDDLQDMWANLLANAADSRDRVLVRTAFPQILRQISKEEALYLAEMFEIKNKAECYIQRWHLTTPNERTYNFDSGEAETLPGPKLSEVSYDNLKRLRLIDSNEETIPVQPCHQPLNASGEKYVLTALGEAFILACQEL